jgi:hypothetical protein
LLIMSQSRRSRRTVCTNRSVYAFATGVRIGVRITRGPFGRGEFVKDAGDLAVAIADQKGNRSKHAGDGEVARLLCDP